MPTLWTFGDSILDCARYNAEGVHPGALLVRNDDALFPEWAGRDLAHLSGAWRLEHRATDGARVGGLLRQTEGVRTGPGDLALVTIGGNDLLGGLLTDPGPGFDRFGAALWSALGRLAPARILLGTVYDPSLGDDRANFTGTDAATARRSLQRMNGILRDAAARHGTLVDLHAHFLGGTPDWFASTIEPSLRGASEVRRAFLDAILKERLAEGVAR